jgi:hypothetical protein
MAMAESDQLVEVLKEIRDELRAVRTELGARGSRMTTSGVRTERVARQGRWRSAALAAGGVAVLALVIGLVTRDRPAPAPAQVAVAAMPPSMPVMPAPPPSAVSPVQVPVAAHADMPTAKPPAVAPPPAMRQAAARPPAGAPARTLASVPAPAKKRVQPDVAAKPPREVTSDEDETMAFPPPPRRVRVHRLSYGPVESEPAKL